MNKFFYARGRDVVLPQVHRAIYEALSHRAAGLLRACGADVKKQYKQYDFSIK